MLLPDGKARPQGPKEVNGMQEVCYCGRSGEIEDREPVMDADGRSALECGSCGHLDHLSWLPADARDSVFEEARQRSDARSMPAA